MLGTVVLSPVDALSNDSPSSAHRTVTLRLQHTPSGTQLHIEQGGTALHSLRLTPDVVRGCVVGSNAPMAGCTAAPAAAALPSVGSALVEHDGRVVVYPAHCLPAISNMLMAKHLFAVYVAVVACAGHGTSLFGRA